MSYRVVITRTAKQDLKEIAVWIAEESKSVVVARRFVEELKQVIRKLDSFPKAGAIPEDRILKNAGFRFVVHKDYLIFYLIDEEMKTVNVLSVFNSKKDYIRVIRNLI